MRDLLARIPRQEKGFSCVDFTSLVATLARRCPMAQLIKGAAEPTFPERFLIKLD